MAITLDQVLSTPPNDDELYQHMVKIGAVIPPPAPTTPKVPDIQPANATPRVPDMSQPAGVDLKDSHPNAPAAAAPKPEPINPGNVPEGVSASAPMAPPDHVLPHFGYKERQSLPTTDQDVGPNSANFYDNEVQRMRDQNANHWGTPENHPGVIGKVGHIAAKFGNIAGDILAPATTALIPGTELNRRVRIGELQRSGAAAQSRETAEEAVRQRPEIAELTGQMREQLEEARDRVRQGIATEHDKALLKVAGINAESRENVADTRAEASTTNAAANNTTKEKIAGLGKSDFDKYYHAQLAEGMPDTAANRLRAHKAWDAASKDQSGGTFIPFYDPQTNAVIGAWNPKNGSVARTPESLSGGMTSQGMTRGDKQESRFDKERKGYQSVIDHTAMADQAATNPTGPGDYTILMSFVNNTKPDTGFRFTEAERKMILEAQSLANQVEANYDKFTTGAFLSQEQRQQMLDINHNAAAQAKANMQHLDAGRVHSSPGSDNLGGAPAGKTSVWDPQGNEHYVDSDKIKNFFAKADANGKKKYDGWTTHRPVNGANKQQ